VYYWQGFICFDAYMHTILNNLLPCGMRAAS